MLRAGLVQVHGWKASLHTTLTAGLLSMYILRPGDQETTVRWVNNVIVSSYNGYTGDLDLDTELWQLGLAMVPGHRPGGFPCLNNLFCYFIASSMLSSKVSLQMFWLIMRTKPKQPSASMALIINIMTRVESCSFKNNDLYQYHHHQCFFEWGVTN